MSDKVKIQVSAAVVVLVALSTLFSCSPKEEVVKIGIGDKVRVIEGFHKGCVGLAHEKRTPIGPFGPSRIEVVDLKCKSKINIVTKLFSENILEIVP